MAEWWMEGALEKLTDADDPVARVAAPRLHLPHRPQHEPRRVAPRPSAHQCRRRQPQPRMARAERRRRAPKCCASATRWTKIGVDLRDGHPRRRGDPRQFPRRVRGHSLADRAPGPNCSSCSATRWSGCRPISRPQKGYEIAAPGQANLSMSTTQLAERFGAVSMTLEMPFKDNVDLPDEIYGWSPERSKYLAARLPRCAARDPAGTDRSASARHRRGKRLMPTPRPAPPRPVAVESGKSLHRLVGRRPDRNRRRGSARRRANC